MGKIEEILLKRSTEIEETERGFPAETRGHLELSEKGRKLHTTKGLASEHSQKQQT